MPSAEINWFAETFNKSCIEIKDAWEAFGAEKLSNEPAPDQLCDAMEQLIELLYRYENSQQQIQPESEEQIPEGLNISELGSYGFSILENFIQMTGDLGLKTAEYPWEQLSVSLALWMARQGAELYNLGLTVNGFASIANQTLDTRQLEQLYHTMGEVLDAVSPIVKEEAIAITADAQHPWRLLVFNRAIVATRTLSPQLMEKAFSAITEYLPEDAPDFFRQGMEQVELQNYPNPVRSIIEYYYQTWPAKRTLH